MPLPMGEVAERSEDGEGKSGCNTLSVTFGDSSPRGRAKGVHYLFYDHPSNAPAAFFRMLPEKRSENFGNFPYVKSVHFYAIILL